MKKRLGNGRAHEIKQIFPRFSINSWRNMRPVRRKDFGLDLVLRFISISFKYMSLLFFPSVSFFVPFWSLSLEIYTIPIIEFIFLNQRRIHDFNTLSYRFFFFTFYHYFFIEKHGTLYSFVLSRTFGFCFRSYKSVRIEVLLYWSRERERERKCKKVKCKEWKDWIFF